MEDNKPIGGSYSFDSENRKKLPAKIVIPALAQIKKSIILSEVTSLVDAEFPNHPGETKYYWCPYDRSTALEHFNQFIEQRFYFFGDYEDAISLNETKPFLFHSALSPLLNSGLIQPNEIIEIVTRSAIQNKIPINSLEGFIRQIIGWREFVRGVYRNFSEQQDNNNFWGGNRTFTKHWYFGSTGIPPLDFSIKKSWNYGYAHHIERLMILSNCMNLAGIHPTEVYRWFMEMYLDSADWVMGPNVYGMGLMSDGGIFATKPYVCSSNYIKKMSDYKDDTWCETLDGLYWNFIEKHKDFYLKNPRVSLAVRQLEKISEQRKKIISKRAEEFIQDYTINFN